MIWSGGPQLAGGLNRYYIILLVVADLGLDLNELQVLSGPTRYSQVDNS